ncbi:MAG: hypothetical protein NWF03_07930 [Candidatus Bathyarchaeota archaeon]|nr:hypothetical protein [Candidatus Bathyarchaeota archaeon]
MVIVGAVFVSGYHSFWNTESEPPEDFFFGVSFGGKTAQEAKTLIDEVKDYTNFLVVASWDLDINETALTEVCDYASESGLSFIVFFDYISLHQEGYTWHPDWVTSAEERWPDTFLGIYIYEEPGGKQIDTGKFDEMVHERQTLFDNVTTYDEAAETFVRELPRGYSFYYLEMNNITRFVSDYALYWFDYLAGYDTVFVELGWNHSTPQQIGLCRGAATTQSKDWGSIIVWNTPDDVSSVKSGDEMYEDMINSYEAGAKYVVVFNYYKYPEETPFGTLTDDHLLAMRQFWSYASNNHDVWGKTQATVAFVLPKNYGWGMRFPEDNIWGLFPADEDSALIWNNMNKLIDMYGLELNIVYDDSSFSYEKYDELYYWNSTIN